MSRIRTVKPDFFRHELLQALESVNLGSYPMLVFEGLWTVCDKAGRFEWRPKQLKLDILPFLEFDMEQTLTILWAAGLVKVYEVDGKRYGLIETLGDHQRFSGSEVKSGPRYPTPTSFISVEPPKKDAGSDKEAPKKQVGKPEGNGVRSTEYGRRKGVTGISADAVPAPSAPEGWPSTWAHDTSQQFLKHGVIITTGTAGNHAKLARDTLPWDEWLRAVDRMALSGEAGYGLPALLRRLPEFRDTGQPDPNRPLTVAEAIAG